ncbi:MAG: GAF domain-containing protein [Deltaproteobacteria bacterium]|nr:GAF domain-containing protein [Deltaproteobacteria bacterium]
MTLTLYRPGWELAAALDGSMLPLWASAALHFGQAFTGALQRRRQRLLVMVSWIVSFTLSGVLFIGWMFSLRSADTGLVMRALIILTGVFAVAAIIFVFWSSYHTCHSAQPSALQRRARTLGASIMLAYGFPSLSLILGPLGVLPHFFIWINLACFALFPLLMGFSILRHHFFDLRIVLSRGLVYAALSLAVSLAYLGLVVLVARLVHKTPAPFLIGLSVAAAVVIFGLLQGRVQRAVDQFVYRSRYVYAKAISKASAALSEELTLESMGETVREALIEAMGLSNAYLGVCEHPGTGQLRIGQLRFYELGPHKSAPDALGHLPSVFDRDDYSPIARAAMSGETVTAHDTVAIAAQSTELSKSMAADPESEADFWLHFNVDGIVPLLHAAHAGTNGERVMGFLVVGAKLDGRPLDPEDRALVHTLAHQLSVALVSAEAFAEVRRLNENLEEQVLARTQELEQTLEALKLAQGRLVESEMQAVLARLVAGVVHEVNTPLGSLRSAVDTIQRTLVKVRPLLEVQREQGNDDARRTLRAIEVGHNLVDVLKVSGERIQGVMGSLQRFINLDEAEQKAIDVRRSIDDVLMLLSAQLDESVVLRKCFPAEPAMVVCYPARLNNVFLNILQNALVALKGAGVIAITVRQDGEIVVVEISDDGPGIAREELEQLFQIGFTTKEGGRMGLRLGLPLAKRWVEEVGGTLEVKSGSGKGTQVRVVLPPTRSLH